MRKIYLYCNGTNCPVKEFLEEANKKIQEKFQYQVAYIKDEHNIFTEPHVKHFSMGKYRQLYELRIKAIDLMVRVIFYKEDDEILLLHAFYKRTRKDTEKALETGLKLLRTILNDGVINTNYRKELI